MICPACGKPMRDIGFYRHKQLTVQKYKCMFCGARKREITRNWVSEKTGKLDMQFKPTQKPVAAPRGLTAKPVEDVGKEEVAFNLGDILTEVLDNLYTEHPRSYDEWDEQGY